MPTEIRVPSLGESVTEATIAQWFKKEGDTVKADEPLVELETDKVTIEVPAPAGGVLSDIRVKDGETVNVGAILGAIAEAGAAAKKSGPQAKGRIVEPPKEPQRPDVKADHPEPVVGPEPVAPRDGSSRSGAADTQSPAVRRLAEESKVDIKAIEGTGKDQRVLKGDILEFMERGGRPEAEAATRAEAPATAKAPSETASEGLEERVRMSRLRLTIARRLKDAQNTAAMLTTFNEVDMSAVMALRNEYKDLFEKKHGVKLGFMSFFVKACVHALREIPAVNAEIDGDEMVYKNYYHIGVAVGTDKGLVVPVVRDADRMSLAGIEKSINDFGKRARDGQLRIDEMQGGTFTISNGGIYGSLMSTPILNAPQSGILGMHKIQQRPVVLDGKIEARPMMYLALSYDHRIVDGKEAVTFLVRVKESLEAPQRLFLDL
ncbi:2-oxoglutarate dehydrogenase E2 component (dihydrolipoamide succinyltransferase) [Rhodoligotrophos appendicifer]|uniref:2-oxoglutarate dehydrogenase complex dihydrolipoyllysine-residue succinyltransferase n=1 Tax=Rhodoligotrophos appendicifer TaxID=987056 RepID=UPI00117CFC3B|nr:2-oxoglutarate dehydrogenase complex dihydrolipoyllysine-residue succinyltransferase [Rhodoligotrophos appendicifer]